ncbi:MAG: DUF177 domain-containing protein [Flavobacteriales bacterium]|nr:DUF177 domain-containing protein [Flavobacteriales bacterium]
MLRIDRSSYICRSFFEEDSVTTVGDPGAYTVTFTNLKDGVHRFEFELDRDFFASIADEELLNGNVAASVELDKKPGMLVADIDLSGTVCVHCDHCNAPFDLPVKGAMRQVYHLNGRQRYDGSEDDVIGLEPDDHRVDLEHPLFECLELALPARRIHPAGECDPEMEAALARNATRTSNGPDPRWAALNTLKETPQGR